MTTTCPSCVLSFGNHSPGRPGSARASGFWPVFALRHKLTFSVFSSPGDTLCGRAAYLLWARLGLQEDLDGSLARVLSTTGSGWDYEIESHGSGLSTT